MKKITLLLIAILLFGTTGSFAQASLYSFASSSGTYVPITGGTVITSSTNSTPSLDSYVSAQQNLPVPFVFNGLTYTTFYVTSNGQLGLGGTAPSEYTTRPLSNSTGTNVIFAPFAADLAAGATGPAEIRFEQVGNEIVVQWRNFRRYAKVESFDFQVRMNTATRDIRFVYNGTPPYDTSTAYQPQVGIKSATGAGNSVALTMPSGSSWNAPVANTTGITDSSIMTFSGAVGFTSGLTYSWIAPPACSATPVGGTVSSATMAVCSGTAPGAITVSGATPSASPGISYQWEQSTDNGTTWTNATGGTGATTLSYTPPAFSGTTIQYRLRVSCAASAVPAYSTVATVNLPTAPTTQASSVTVTAANTNSTSFTTTWTNGNGSRRVVYVSNAPITSDPVSGTAPANAANAMYVGTGSQMVYDGTGTSVTVSGLNCNTTYYIKVYEYTRCGSGPYDYYYNTTTGTNATTVVTGTPAMAAGLPVINNFAGFTGSNLATAVPGWYEAAIASSSGVTPTSSYPAGTSSMWTNSTLSGVSTAKINMYVGNRNEWIISPKIALTSNSRVAFKAAKTAYNATTAATSGVDFDADDKVTVLISTDGCGAIWAPLYTFSQANAGGANLTNALTQFSLNLSAYTGQTVQIAFQATTGPLSGATDFDFHIGNIVIETIPNCDSPSAVSVTSYSTTGVNFSWAASASNPSGGYQYEIRTSGAPGSGATGLAATGTTAAGVLSATNSTLAANTNYSVYVRSNCGGTDFSSWTTATTFFTGYCMPTSTNATTYINTFATTGYFANINNAASGYTAPGYQNNYNTMSVAGYAGGNVPFSLSFVGGSLGIGVWVDWNNNLIFEDSEKMFNTTSYTTTNPYLSGFTIPAGTANGDYRMRVVVDYNMSNPIACFSGAERAEAEDYKLTVITQPTETVDYANLQSFVSGVTPAAVTSIQTCQTVEVYAQVYEPGVTEAAGAGAGLTVWIGYQTTNTDPATWPASAWVPATFNTNVGNNDEYKRVISGLSAGTYYFASRVTLNGGPFKYGASNSGFYNATTNPSAPLTVNAIPAITVAATTPAICAGSGTALNVTTTGTDYTYSWMPGNLTGASQMVSPTTTTTYTVTATDAISGCTTTGTVTVTVNPLPAAVVVTPSTTVTCANEVVTLTATGGNIIAVNKIGSGTATNTSSTPFRGFYGGSRTQAIYTAAELTALGLQAGSSINSIGYVVTAGTPIALNNFSITAGLTTSSSSAVFLSSVAVPVFSSASYTAAGVPGTLTFTLPTPIIWDGTSNLVVQSCFNNNNGGGVSGNNLSVQSSTVASGLNIYLSIDNNATVCSSTEAPSTTTTRPNLVIGSTTAGTVTWSPVANLFSDAQATTPYVSGTGATTVYFKSATAGSNAFTVTSASAQGCTATTTANVTVNSTAAPIAANMTFCNTTPTVADLTATGTAIKWYAAATGGTMLTNDLALVSGATYYVSQTLNGCESARTAVTVTISTVAVPAVTVTQPACGQTAGSLTVTSPVGSDFNYSINGGAYQALPSFTNLTAGTYTITVQNAAGCTSVAAPVVINAAPAVPAAPVVAITQPTCAAAEGTIVVTSPVGSDFNYSINGGAYQVLPTFANLTAGTYTITVQNAAGCTAVSDPIVINVAPEVPSAPVVTVSQPACGQTTGSLTVTSPVGSDFNYSINGGAYQALPSFANLTAGTYTVTVQNTSGCTSVSAPVVINASPVVPDAPVVTVTQPSCGVAGSIVVASPVGSDFNYSINGGAYQVLPTFTNLIAGTYTITVQNASGCTSVSAPIVINAAQAVPAAPVVPAAQSFCAGATVASLTATGSNLQWYASATGGTVLAGTEALSNGTVYYVSQTVNGCEGPRAAVTATVTTVTAPEGTDVTVCSSYTLPALTNGNYYTGAGGTGMALPAGTEITQNTTVYIYAVSGACSDETSFTVTVNPIAAPTGEAVQTVSVTDLGQATIEDIVVTATGAVTWYATAEDAAAGTEPIAAGTMITTDTYYAVNTVGNCTSAPFEVTVTVALGRDGFTLTNITYYPNPVVDVLTVTYSNNITLVEVYNLLGQRVIAEQPGTITAKVNMARLEAATYIVRVTADGKTADFKVLKN